MADNQPKFVVSEELAAQAKARMMDQPEMSDTLLKPFSEKQRQYIVKHLYPEISKALVHFISEAVRHNQIDETDGVGGGALPASQAQTREPP